MATIQGIYVALFGRPADPAGLAFFNNATNNGADLTAIGDLATQPEYLDRFTGFSPTQIVTAIYQSLFNRNPDLAGLNYFVAELTSGRQNINTIAINILDGAQNEDLTTVNNKIAAANNFTAAVDTNDEIAAYQGAAAANAGVGFLDNITDDAATIPDAAATDAAIAAIVDFGNAFTLTNGVDIFSGTTFNAPRGFTPGGTDQVNTLNNDDVLTGTGATDKLNVEFVQNADIPDAVITPTLNDVEVVNIKFATAQALAIVDMQDSFQNAGDSDATSVNLSRISQTTGVAGVINLGYVPVDLSINDTNAPAALVALGFTDKGAAGATDKTTLTLNNVQVNGVGLQEFVDATDPANPIFGNQGIENVTLVSVGSANKVGTIAAEELEILTITGDQDLQLGLATQVKNANGSVEATIFAPALLNVTGSLSTVDASALTGNLDIAFGGEVVGFKDDTSGVNVDFSVTSGSGNDVFRLNAGLNAGDVFDGGTGDNTAVLFATATAGSITNVQHLRVEHAIAGVITVDTSILDKLEDVTVRNTAPGTATTVLNNLTAPVAAGLTIEHAVTNGNGLANNILTANLADATGGSDLVGLKIVDNVNLDPRFSVQLRTTAVENITLVDQDTESNAVQLGVAQDVTDITGTVLVTGGQDGLFFNLDATGNIYGFDQSGGAGADQAAGAVQDIGAGGAERFNAATIDASGTISDVIVRVSDSANAAGVFTATGAQTIKMGDGDDTVIFDRLGDTRAGLTISDTVSGGAGNNTLAIDGDGVKITIGASEWTNVSGFQTIRLVGNAVGGTNDVFGNNSYNLRLTNDLIDTNGVNGLINIVNDNDPTDEGKNFTSPFGGGQNRGVTIDGLGLDANHNFTYDGAEGAADQTADRFMLRDASINGKAVIDGGFLNFNTLAANNDVLEARNASVVTIGDLANTKNVGTLSFTNDLAVSQTSDLVLNTGVIDALVNSTHAASAAEREILTVNASGNENVAGASTKVNIDVTGVNFTTTGIKITTNGNGEAVVTVAGAGGAIEFAGGGGKDTYTGTAFDDTINGGGGDDTLNGAGGDDTIGGGAGTDILLGGTGDDKINGGTGSDTITGGAGGDTLTGGTGADTFVYNPGDSLFINPDSITDFATGVDTILFAPRIGASVDVENDGSALTTAQMIAAANAQMVAGFNDSSYFFNAAGSGDAFVFYDTNANGVFDQGSDNFIVLVGINSAAEIAPGDIDP